MAGLFIDVEVADEIRDDAEMAQKLADACPVDIYANKNGTQDAGESGLAGFVVNIISNGSTVASRTTDASGFFRNRCSIDP